MISMRFETEYLSWTIDIVHMHVGLRNQQNLSLPG